MKIAFPSLSRVFQIAALLLVSCVLAFGQGSLTPPGAPAPMMKTLQQVEPRIDVATLPGSATADHTISQSGSYFLSSNLDGSSGKDAIEITAPGVNLDLNGFVLTGLAPRVAIRVLADYVSVRNGTIGAGSIITTGDFLSCEQLLFAGNNLSGGNRLRVEKCLFDFGSNLTGGSGCTVADCKLATGSKINLGAQATIDRCTVFGASGVGVQTGAGAIITKTQVTSSNGSGFVTGTGGTLTDCMAIGNTGDGFDAGAATSMKGCVANGNQGSFGMRAEMGSSLSHCVAEGNNVTFGISVASRSVVSHCAAVANTSNAAVSGGIDAGGESTVLNCTASINTNANASLNGSTGSGIAANNSSTVKDCNVTGNTGDGIRVSFDSQVIGNNCDSNGAGAGDGAGIHVTSSDTRVENNNVTDGDRGVDVDTSGCVILRNTASGNTTNWDVAAGNVFFAVSAATTASAVTGASGGVSQATTDPTANLSY